MGPDEIALDDPIYQPGAHIWGWMMPDELAWLRETAATMGSVVEVGVLRGRSAFALCTGCPGPVYGIDPWDDDGNQAYPAVMADLGHFGNWHPVKGYSPAAADRIPGNVDMTFLDGAHDAASIRADIEAWLPRTNRLLCGHDYSPVTADQGAGYPDVRTVVDEMFGDEVYVIPGLSIWTVALGGS